MALYMIRHGESESNVLDIHAGQRIDMPLTLKGEQQAKHAAEKLRNYGITHIVASPLVRAMQTAEIIAAELGGLTIYKDARLAEFDQGELSGQPYTGFSSRQIMAVDGAEDSKAFLRRVCAAVQDHVRDGANVLLVAHAGPMMMLKCALDGGDLNTFYDYPHISNAEIMTINVRKVRVMAKSYNK